MNNDLVGNNGGRVDDSMFWEGDDCEKVRDKGDD